MAKDSPKTQRVPKPKVPMPEPQAPGLRNYDKLESPQRNALAQRLAAEYKSKQMLAPNRFNLPLSDEVGQRPAPSFSLNRFDPKILGGPRRDYENWRVNARAPKVEFGGVVTSILDRA
jgi:hypothetical protein